MGEQDMSESQDQGEPGAGPAAAPIPEKVPMVVGLSLDQMIEELQRQQDEWLAAWDEALGLPFLRHRHSWAPLGQSPGPAQVGSHSLLLPQAQLESLRAVSRSTKIYQTQ